MRTESEDFAEKREGDDPKDLTTQWKRTKTEGKGVKLLGKRFTESIAYLFDENDTDRVGFLQVR